MDLDIYFSLINYIYWLYSYYKFLIFYMILVKETDTKIMQENIKKSVRKEHGHKGENSQTRSD